MNTIQIAAVLKSDPITNRNFAAFFSSNQRLKLIESFPLWIHGKY